jgi:Spy/CpxP family protein refolding chaperone
MEHRTSYKDGRNSDHHRGEMYDGRHQRNCGSHYSEKGRNRPHHSFSHKMESLNLTDAQKNEIEKMHQTTGEQMQDLKDKMHALKKEEFTLLKEGKLDSAKASSLSAQIGQYKEKMEFLKLKNMMTFNSILTTEQKEKLKELHEKKETASDKRN